MTNKWNKIASTHELMGPAGLVIIRRSVTGGYNVCHLAFSRWFRTLAQAKAFGEKVADNGWPTA